MSTFSLDDHISALTYLMCRSWKHRRFAIEQLLALDTPASRQAIMDALRDMRYRADYWDALHILDQCNFLDALSIFRYVIQKSRDSLHQYGAIRFLRRYPAETVADFIGSMLDIVANHPLRYDIFRLLSYYNDDNTIYLLIRFLKQYPDSDVQLSVATALGYSQSPKALSALLDVLNDVAASDRLKEFAMNAIYRLLEKGVQVDHDQYFVGTLTCTLTQRFAVYKATDCLRKARTPLARRTVAAISEQSRGFKPNDSLFFP